MNAEVGPVAVPRSGLMLGLWAGWLAGPVAWAGQFLVAFVMVPRASAGWGLLPIHLSTVAGLLGTALGGWLAWRAWRGGGGWGGWPPSADEEKAGWVSFLAIQGLLTAPLFAVVILSQWAAVVLLHPYSE